MLHCFYNLHIETSRDGGPVQIRDATAMADSIFSDFILAIPIKKGKFYSFKKFNLTYYMKNFRTGVPLLTPLAQISYTHSAALQL